MKSEHYFPKDNKEVSVIEVGRFVAPKEVVVPSDNPTQAILRAALMRLGPNGERWGHFYQEMTDGKQCVFGALDAVTSVANRRRIVLEIINPIIGPWGADHVKNVWPMFWNDQCKDFAEIRTMFHRAISLAGTAA